MAEYIEREAAYDIFSAKQQELLKFYRYYQLNDEEKEEFNRYDSYLNEIEAIPTADVVEVVRCKDCSHCIVNEKHPDKPLICCRTKMCGTTKPEWFCADGEKKEGAEE